MAHNKVKRRGYSWLSLKGQGVEVELVSVPAVFVLNILISASGRFHPQA